MTSYDRDDLPTELLHVERKLRNARPVADDDSLDRCARTQGPVDAGPRPAAHDRRLGGDRRLDGRPDRRRFPYLLKRLVCRILRRLGLNGFREPARVSAVNEIGYGGPIR